MRMVALIERKRDGGTLSADEITWLIKGYTKGTIPDYQMSAMLMAVFVNSLDQMPDLDAIVAGMEVPVPREIDLQYAIAAALVGRAIRARDDDNAQLVTGNILRYAGRFPQREMGVMLVSDLHRAIGTALFEVPAFAAWAQAVSDVMLFE